MTVPDALDLRTVAEWTGATIEEIRDLNPELRRTTTPIGTHELKVPAGKSASQAVTEERLVGEQVALTNADDGRVRFFLSQPVISPKVKAALEEVLKLWHALQKTQRDLQELGRQLKTITDDQTRLRANLKEMPPTAAAYKRYLEKFDKQETEIEALQEEIKKMQGVEHSQRKEVDAFLAKLNAE